MLGDIKPSTLQVITKVNSFHNEKYTDEKVNLLPGEKQEAIHALQQQLANLSEWQSSPPPPGTKAWKGLTLVTVKCENETDEVALTIGEMNTLADYFGSMDQLKKAKKQTVNGILQQVRRDSWVELHKVLTRIDPDAAKGEKQPAFAGAITSASGLAKEAAIEAFTNDGRNKASQTYLANANRNACHFAPQSWYRWKEKHEEARGIARKAFDAKEAAKKKKNDPLIELSEKWANEAMVTNGFGDHYLQDSFAGGHLINKTLIMQWFVEWLGKQPDTTFDPLKKKLPGPMKGLVKDKSIGERWVKDWDNVKNMTPALQGKLAGVELYDRPASGVATDPQTVEEQKDRAERIKRAGIAGGSDAEKSKNYDAYLSMMNNALIQMATKVLHDEFCAKGLVVGANGRKLGRVFGDDAMITGGDAVSFSAETAQKSQKAITDIIQKGKAADTVDQIMGRLPNEVTPPTGGPMIPLKDWHTGGILKKQCEAEFFPKVLTEYPKQLGLAPASSGKISEDVAGGGKPSPDIQSKVKWMEEKIADFKKALPDFGAIKREIEEKIEALKQGAKALPGKAKALWDSAVSGAKSGWNWIKSGVGAAGDAAKELGSDVATGAAETRDDAIRKLESVKDDVWSLGADMAGRLEALRQQVDEIEIPDEPDAEGAAPDKPVAMQGAANGDASGGDF